MSVSQTASAASVNAASASASGADGVAAAPAVDSALRAIAALGAPASDAGGGAAGLIAALGAPLAADDAPRAGGGAAGLIAALGAPFEPDASRASQAILNLKGQKKKKKKKTEAASQAALVVKLAPKEQLLVRKIFQTWSLDNRISFLDLWALDLHATFQALPVPKTLSRELIGNFMKLYFYLIRQNVENKFKAILKVKATINIDPLSFSPAQFCTFIEGLEKSLEGACKSALGKKANAQKKPALEEAFQTARDKVQLALTLWKEPGSALFFNSFEVYRFEESAALNGGDPKKTLRHLIEFTRLIDEIAKHPGSGMDVKAPAFYQCLTHLNAMTKEGITISEAQGHKKRIIAWRDEFARFLYQVGDRVGAACEGTFDYDMLCKTDNKRKDKKVTTSSFIAALIKQYQEAFFLDSKFNVLLRIADTRILCLLFPQLPKNEALIKRLAWNHYYFPIYLDQSWHNHLEVIHPVVATATDQIVKSTTEMFNAIVGNPIIDRCMKAFNRRMILFDKAGRPPLMMEWHEMINDCVPTLAPFRLVLGQLEKKRQDLLELTGQLLRTLPLSFLASNGRALIQNIQKNCFQSLFPLCSLVMIFQDVEAITCNRTEEQLEGEAHLIPAEMANWMQFEGSQELYEQVVYEKEEEVRQMAAALAAPPKPAAPPQAAAAPKAGEGSGAPKKEPPPAPPRPLPIPKPSPKPSPKAHEEEFRLRSGSNIRTVLKELKALGFFKIDQTGSHIKLKKEGGGVVIVPNNDNMPTGTLTSISKQVVLATAKK
jgi:predicted RNA binding protein YcfA (HicA-like mRNA interferase family)